MAKLPWYLKQDGKPGRNPITGKTIIYVKVNKFYFAYKWILYKLKNF